MVMWLLAFIFGKWIRFVVAWYAAMCRDPLKDDSVGLGEPLKTVSQSGGKLGSTLLALWTILGNFVAL